MSEATVIETETYEAKVECPNCGTVKVIKVKKGVQVKNIPTSDYGRKPLEAVCEYCGCKVEFEPLPIAHT